MRTRRLLAALALALALAGAAPAHPARAAEAYYLLVFAAQRVPNAPHASHTFATFVRARWPDDGSRPPTLEACTISWLPATLDVRTLALCPEPGRNLGLHETLRLALGRGARVSLWGPYRIDADLYGRALRQAALLGSGRLLYKANDLGYCSDEVSNCVRAVSSLADGYRLRVAVPGWGEAASYRALCKLSPWVLDGGRAHPWVGAALGLDRYPIIARGWEPPWGEDLRGLLDRLVGREEQPPACGPAAP
jgi:hypothetical protein